MKGGGGFLPLPLTAPPSPTDLVLELQALGFDPWLHFWAARSCESRPAASLQLSFYVWEMSATGWGPEAASESPGWTVQGFGGQRGGAEVGCAAEVGRADPGAGAVKGRVFTFGLRGQRSPVGVTEPLGKWIDTTRGSQTLSRARREVVWRQGRVGKESEVAQSCPTLCGPMDCSPPGSSIHGIFQARALERGAIAFSRGSSRARVLPEPGIEPGSPVL